MSDLAQKIRAHVDDPAEQALRPDLLAAGLRAVLDIHKPMEWFEECMKHPVPRDDDPRHDDYWDTHHYVGPDRDIVACEEMRLPDRCSGCTPEHSDDESVTSVVYPCPTVRAIASALGVREDGED